MNAFLEPQKGTVPTFMLIATMHRQFRYIPCTTVKNCSLIITHSLGLQLFNSDILVLLLNRLLLIISSLSRLTIR